MEKKNLAQKLCWQGIFSSSKTMLHMSWKNMLLELLILQSLKLWEESPNNVWYKPSILPFSCRSKCYATAITANQCSSEGGWQHNLAGRTRQRTTGNRSHTKSSALTWMKGQTSYSWVSLTLTELECRLESMWALFTPSRLPGNSTQTSWEKGKYVCFMALSGTIFIITYSIFFNKPFNQRLQT